MGLQLACIGQINHTNGTLTTEKKVFTVLDGVVEMLYKENGIEQSAILNTGDIFYASVGTEHVAHPKGEARILVIESEGSV